MDPRSLTELKSTACLEIEKRGDEAIRVAKNIMENPEPGYREYKTSKVVADEFRKLKIPFEVGIAITGIKGILDTGRPGPTVAVIGELDSHIVKGHPHSNPDTNAAHACGHNTQIGMLVSVARGLLAPGIMENLSGKVALMAIPAEEYIEIGYRESLRKQGKIEFLVGKPEFVKLGAFDDVDISIMTHSNRQSEQAKFEVGGTFNGMIAKLVRFEGISAHAGSEPHLGINALNAATIALGAIHAQRETFPEEDTVRVHPIITRGGGAVSAVPDDVRIETFIRAKTMEAVAGAAHKVDRALKSGAMATGASVSITTLSGYLPLENDPNLQQIYTSNLTKLIGQNSIRHRGHDTGSTDMGDLSKIMPVAHPFVNSASGKAHGVNYLIEDYPLTVIGSAKAMLSTVIDLLNNHAKQGREIISSFEAPMTKNVYLETLRGYCKEEAFVFD